MNNRQETILQTVITEHITTGAPVSSNALVDKYGLDCSSATVRHEMAELEEAGWIYQPHTSAGRLPTEKAYQWFVRQLSDKPLPEPEQDKLTTLLAQPRSEAIFKQTAKELAALSGLAVFWAYHKNNVFYTGISNLLAQPEFGRHNLVYDISAIIDRVDEIIATDFHRLPDGGVILGQACPFGAFAGAVTAHYHNDGQQGIFGIIGPVRQDYGHNLALVQFLRNTLE